MTYIEATRECREKFIRNHYELRIFLDEKAVQDFIDGKYKIRQYAGVPILDYTEPWGS